MAKLVAAVCPKCGAGVQLDPSREFVTCSYCNTSSFIETKKRPVTQQIAQAHYPVIHVKQSGAALVVMPIILVSVLGIAGAGLAAFLSMSKTMDAIPVAFQAARENSPTPPSLARGSVKPAVKENLFADATGIYGKFAEKIGTPVKATELVLYPEYAIMTAQNPKNVAHVDRYTYRYGDVSDPDPVRLSGSDKKNFEKELFDVSSIDFSKVPTIVADALTAIPVEEGKVSHIILDKGLPFRSDLRFRVYVNGPRDSGYVEYKLTGERGRVVN